MHGCICVNMHCAHTCIRHAVVCTYVECVCISMSLHVYTRNTVCLIARINIYVCIHVYASVSGSPQGLSRRARVPQVLIFPAFWYFPPVPVLTISPHLPQGDLLISVCWGKGWFGL